MPVKKAYTILIVTPTFGKYGGIEAMVFNLAKRIKEKSNLNVKVCFKRVKGFNVTEQLAKVFKEANIPFSSVTRASTALFKEILQADLIHGQNTSPDIIFFSKLLQKPLILHMHDGHWPNKRLSMQAFLWRLGIKLADYRTYVSRFVWRNWEPSRFSAQSSCMPSVPELTDAPSDFKNRKGFIFVSRWIKNKGLRTLLQAYLEADIDKETWPLTLVGDGPLKPWVDEFLQKNPLPSVRCTGFLSGQEGQKQKAMLIGQSKWLISPANKKEGLGMTPLEARYLSVPSIVTRDGGLPEAAGPSAILCEPNNIQSLKEGIEKATRIKAQEYEKRSLEAKATLDHFIKDPVEYVKIYQSLLNPTAI